MRRLILMVLSLFAFSAHATLCHTVPTAEDRAFYDKAAVSATAQFTWAGQPANQFAFALIYERRQAFYGDAYAMSGPPLDAEENALWDALVLAAIQKGVYNTSGVTPWLGYYPASIWAHGIAWDAMYYRMTTKCP